MYTFYTITTCTYMWTISSLESLPKYSNHRSFACLMCIMDGIFLSSYETVSGCKQLPMCKQLLFSVAMTISVGCTQNTLYPHQVRTICLLYDMNYSFHKYHIVYVYTRSLLIHILGKKRHYFWIPELVRPRGNKW